mgnify:FL=1
MARYRIDGTMTSTPIAHTTDETETCDRCGARLTTEAQALGWPIGVPPEDDDAAEEYICPDCYGDGGYCPAGHVLPATVDSSTCPRCDA